MSIWLGARHRTRFRCGGLALLCRRPGCCRIASTQVVTYRQRQSDHPFLDDLLQQDESPEDVLWL